MAKLFGLLFFAIAVVSGWGVYYYVTHGMPHAVIAAALLFPGSCAFVEAQRKHEWGRYAVLLGINSSALFTIMLTLVCFPGLLHWVTWLSLGVGLVFGAVIALLYDIVSTRLHDRVHQAA